MLSTRSQRMLKEAMGPEAPLTRAEERAALAGTITLLVVAAIAMIEIVLSQPQRPAEAAAARPEVQAIKASHVVPNAPSAPPPAP